MMKGEKKTNYLDYGKIKCGFKFFYFTSQDQMK